MTKRTPAEIWKALDAQAGEEELERILALGDDALDRELETAGFDAKSIGDQGAILASESMARRGRLAWQVEAQEKLDDVRAKFSARTPLRPRRSRGELLAAITQARSHPRLAQPVAVMFRNRTADEASDEELSAILEEIEALIDHEH